MQYSCREFSPDITNLFPEFVRLYLERVEGTGRFYSFYPDPPGYSAAIENIGKREFNRQLLVSTLRNQHAGIDAPGHIQSWIDALADKNTFTVCTGHQLQFFTGPLYFVYKILTISSLAEKLKKEHPDKNFIPVFWLAGEDHDLEEILPVNLTTRKLKVNLKGKGPVGRMKPEGFEEVLSALENDLAGTPCIKEFCTSVSAAYRNSGNLADATRRLIYRLFDNLSPLVIDPDDPHLKRLLVPKIINDITEGVSAREVNKSIKDISSTLQLNKVQVQPRSSGYFFLGDGDRTRILPAGQDRWTASDKHWDRESLLSEIQEHPEHFSPDVMNRPLYQQIILPNIAYVGGPAEVSYWLQLKRLFDHEEVFFPIIHPRKSFLVLTPSEHRIMEKYGVEDADLFRNPQELLNQYLREKHGESISLEAEKKELERLLERIRKRAGELDATLDASAVGHARRVIRAIESLEKKLLKAVRRRERELSNDFEALFSSVYPGTPQERYYNLAQFYSRYGMDFLKTLASCTDPFSFGLSVLKIR